MTGATNAPRPGAFSDVPAAAVFALALVLRLAWVIFVHAGHTGDAAYLQSDAMEYTTVARNLLGGRGWWSPDEGGGPYFHGPVFPLFLASFLGLGLSLFWITVAQAVIGAATCWGVVRLGRRFTSPPGALAAGLVMAVYPYFFQYTGLILTETLSVLFGLLIFATLIQFSRDPSRTRAAVAGLVLGVATLHHPETYMAPPLLLLWGILFHPDRARAMKGLLLTCVVMGLTVLPWHAYHAVKNGKNILLPPSMDAGGLLSQGTLVAKGRLLRDPSYRSNATRLEREGQALEAQQGMVRAVGIAAKRVLEDAGKDPGAYLWLVAMKFRRMWGLAPESGIYARPWITIPTGILNLTVYLGCVAGLVLYRPREEAWLALTIMAMATFPHLVFYAQPRYRLPVMPIVILFAGVAFGALLDRLHAGRLAAALGASGERRSGG